MKPVLKAFALLVAVAAVAGAILLWYILTTGLSAREQPGYLEEFAARRVRTMVIARRARSLQNPVEYSGEVIAAGRAHFADHCAICHANDGSGDTPLGRGMWPKVPDMRMPATQDLSEGELFWIIENGIRFTGMPGWSTGTKEGEEASWHLVHFIRRLPRLTPPELEEMEALNPKSPEEWQQMQAEREFLEGGGEISRNNLRRPRTNTEEHQGRGGMHECEDRSIHHRTLTHQHRRRGPRDGVAARVACRNRRAIHGAGPY